MNLSDCKTIEQYREAAHYWQKKWADSELRIEQLYIEIDRLNGIIITFGTKITASNSSIPLDTNSQT